MAKNKIKLESGTVFQKQENGTYYYRSQIKGQRKQVSLKTKIQKEAITKAKELASITQTTSVEIIAAHVLHAKSLKKKLQQLELTRAFSVYEEHPDRATPATVSEELNYKSSYNRFINFLNQPGLTIHDVTPQMTDQYAKHMRTLEISVSTHNRHLNRLKKIFEVLADYSDEENPFKAPSLRRKKREEQDINDRRKSFSKKQEKDLLRVLEDDSFEMSNKEEMRVIYYLGMFTAQRMKDCVLLHWSKVDLNRGRIWVKQFKTGKEVSLPIAPQLLEVLKEVKRKNPEGYINPHNADIYKRTNSVGKNIGNQLVNIHALNVIKWIGLEPSVKVEGRKRKVTVYGFHSLRHA